MTDLVIQAAGLTKYFGRRLAVDSVELRVPRGTVYGLLGRNGAGKTTIIKMLMGLLAPTRGRSSILGRDSQDLDPATKARTGYLPEGHPVYPWMRVGEAGGFVAAFYEDWNARVFSDLLSYFDMEPRARVRSLSRGQKAQLSLALVLAQEPELLVMDDPTLGLDAVVRREFLESIVELIQAQGRTVLFSSHIISDVERVADRIAVLDRGVLRADCSVDTFRHKVKRVHLRFPGAPPELPEVPGLLRRTVREREVTLTIAAFDESAIERLRETGPESVEVVDLGLEDAFVEYTSGRESAGTVASILGRRGRGPA